MKFNHRLSLLGLTTAAAVVSASPLPLLTSVNITARSPDVGFSASASASASLSATSSGQATYYEGNVAKGTCSFDGYTLPAGIFGSALSVSAWDDASNCGACLSIQGPGGVSIKTMIVDQCPSCNVGHFDLFQEAFAALSPLATGLLDISYTFVPCDITSPIVLKNKDGASPYWFSMQVVNANVPVAKLEVSTDGGNTWQATQREQYNFFNKEGGFGTSVVDVRITSKTGKVITVNGVSVGSGVTHTAGENF